MARISGTTKTSASSRMGLASEEVGPLVPSTMALALILGAFSAVIWPSRAQVVTPLPMASFLPAEDEKLAGDDRGLQVPGVAKVVVHYPWL